jgi:hypothetical protein
MPTIYVRVSHQNYDYVRDQALQAQTTQAAVIDAVLDEARRRGWTVDQAREITIKETHGRGTASE